MNLLRYIKKEIKNHGLNKARDSAKYHKRMIQVWKNVLEESGGHHNKAEDSIKYHERMSLIYDDIAQKNEFDLKRLEREG